MLRGIRIDCLGVCTELKGNWREELLGNSCGSSANWWGRFVRLSRPGRLSRFGRLSCFCFCCFSALVVYHALVVCPALVAYPALVVYPAPFV